jgi:hypothetical protein
MLNRCLVLLTLLLAVLLSGCGGGGGGQSLGGSVAIAFRWPAVTKAIPTGAMSLVFSITGGPTELKKTVNRPLTYELPRATGETTERVEFFGVYTGQLTLTVSAYDQSGGTGNLLAYGTTPLNIQPGRQSAVALTLENAPAYLNITAPTGNLEIGKTTTVTATAYDNFESVVLLPAGSIEWSADPTSVATISSDGVLIGVTEGMVTVTAKIKNLPITNTMQIQVQPPLAAPAPSAVPLADAIVYNESYGANHLSWTMPPTNVAAVLVYRNTNPTIPIAILPQNHNYYFDSGAMLPNEALLENTAGSATIDPATGAVLTLDRPKTYESTIVNLTVPNETLTTTTYNVTCRRMQLTPGFQCAYQLRYLMVVPTTRATGTTYSLELSGKSPLSSTITTIMPPILITENNIEPSNAEYQCSTVNGADFYTVQVSTDPNFAPQNCVYAHMPMSTQGVVTITLPMSTAVAMLNIQENTTIYWRMGARLSVGVQPAAASNANYAGWVYSASRNYVYMPAF